MPSDVVLEVRAVGKVFRRGRNEVQALAEVSLSVRRNEFLTLIGPSGCGKSTLLHMIGGFDRATSGEILLEGRRVEGPGRDRGMMFQDATLYPWWTVLRNVRWSYELGGASRRDATVQAQRMLDVVGLGSFANAYPGELSGGMRQRVALARTLALRPQILLMDEPFGALDSLTREAMQEELNRIWQDTGITVLFVTHDINEAVFLGDRTVVMTPSPGRIEEVVEVELLRPRDAELKKSPEFVEYHNRLWDLLSGIRREGPSHAGAMH